MSRSASRAGPTLPGAGTCSCGGVCDLVDLVAHRDAAGPHDVGPQAGAVDHPLEDAVVRERLDVVAGLAPLGSHGLHLAHPEALAEQVDQTDSGGEQLAANSGVRHHDSVVVVEHRERLSLNKRDVSAAEVTVAWKALVGHVDVLDRVRQLLVLGGDSYRLYESSHGDQRTLPGSM